MPLGIRLRSVLYLTVIISFQLFAFEPRTFASTADMLASVESLQPAFLKAGGSKKTIEQLKCFIRKHGNETFATKPLKGEISERCNTPARIAIDNPRAVAIIDYTMLSNRPRFFIFDFQAKKIEALHTAHGRYGDTPRNNTVLSMKPKRNSILKAVHFSNEPEMNASVGGFFLTGDEYQGHYGRSVILHGLEGDVNDNACQRATVIHRSGYISADWTGLMSSGCPMISREKINWAVDTLKRGALIYMFTPVEEALSDNDCGRNLLY